jgi:hypothetical protein
MKKLMFILIAVLMMACSPQKRATDYTTNNRRPSLSGYKNPNHKVRPAKQYKPRHQALIQGRHIVKHKNQE